MVRELDPDEMIDRWTLVGDELDLMSGKLGATRLGFALMLRFYTERGRFARGRSEIPDAAVEYVARQVGVERTEIAFMVRSDESLSPQPDPRSSEETTISFGSRWCRGASMSGLRPKPAVDEEWAERRIEMPYLIKPSGKSFDWSPTATRSVCNGCGRREAAVRS